LTFRTYDGDQPAAHVLSLNVRRRQLTQSQKAMLATDFLPHLEAEGRRGEHLRTMPRDERGHTVADPDSESKDSESGDRKRAAARAAEQVGVGHAQVVRANKVKKERVRAGDLRS
jgi:hypothetical protein